MKEQNNNRISDIFTGILIICAVIITALVVRQQLFSNGSQSELNIRTISNWQEIKFKGPRSGPEGSPVEIIEFYDYQCPYCKQVQLTLKAIRKNYRQQVSIKHQHLPLPNHDQAVPAAIAAECARDQGRFTPLHDLLFKHQSQLGEISYDSLALGAGIPDVETFSQCLEQEQTKDRVTASQQQAGELGINATPSFLINGQLVSGALPYNRLKQIIDEAVYAKKDAQI